MKIPTIIIGLLVLSFTVTTVPAATTCTPTVTCKKTKSVKSDDTCVNIEQFQNVTDATLHRLNPSLAANCSNLLNLKSVCLSGTVSSCPSTTTSSKTTSTTKKTTTTTPTTTTTHKTTTTTSKKTTTSKTTTTSKITTTSKATTTTKTTTTTTKATTTTNNPASMCSATVIPTDGNGFFVATGYSARVWSNGIGKPRQIATDTKGNLLVVDTTNYQIWALTGNVSDPCTIATKTLIIDGSSLPGGLTHGISLYGGYIWASNTNSVFRWPYTDGSLQQITTNYTLIVTNMNGADHATRTMAFDPNGNMVIGRGSTANVMEGFQSIAVLRRFSASSIINPPSAGIDYSTGTLVSYGNRNEVGLRYDHLGRLWGIENGADVLDRADLGGEIYPTNPAEELNLFDTDGNFYGYPYCWTEYNLTAYTAEALGAGAQWAYPGFMPDNCNTSYSRCDITDDWCRQTANNIPPKLALEAHDAPLDVEFYERSTGCQSASGFPCSQIHDAFAAMHGSSLKNLPHGKGVGYKVVHIPFDSNTNLPTGTVIDIFGQLDTTSCPGTCIRPVSVTFDLQGRLFISSDNTGEIFVITRSS